jgi:uncharacterized iron-regulated protein
MRLIKIIFVAIIFLVAAKNEDLFSDSNQNILPLGNSKYRYKIEKIEKDQIIDTSTLKVVKIEDIINQNMDKDVFIIGEAHDNYDCHVFQRDFIKSLYKKHPKIVVGFEFFMRDDEEILEQWRLGKISEVSLIKKTQWYKKTSQNYGYTRLIMDVIKKYKIKTIGLNVPRTILRKVSRKGFDSLSPEEKELFPTLHITNTQHEYFIKSIFGTFAAQVPFWFKNIYNAQKCWDVIMAESMRKTLALKKYKGYKGIIIAGSNHVAYGLGIPFRYKSAHKKAALLTIMPILLPEEKTDKDKEEEKEDENPMIAMMSKNLAPAGTFSRGIGDYVFSATQPLNHHFPVIGMTVKEKEGKFVITRVKKKSIAAKNGIQKDDTLVAFDGVEITSLEQFRLLLAQKDWKDSVDLKIIKRMELEQRSKEEK